MEHGRNLFGFTLVAFGWIFNALSPSMIPGILASIASLAGLVNYVDQILARRRKSR